ncbi:hypothetical protein P171DRAFT_478816 [Karstenula rhodostoma CBS 690.94]|uniref:Uncharacterized protein n=1 Tax=Karstenula rhodostoma CBS 690.94 TaxID=1392251 RepID=A0A9P4UJY0_9PLEO|nr:hypothetical protein P171DRAFT_478816 [Karstenula rhodostoma CBS 690.94]
MQFSKIFIFLFATTAMSCKCWFHNGSPPSEEVAWDESYHCCFKSLGTWRKKDCKSPWPKVYRGCCLRENAFSDC